jgi:hypothetical protein
VFERGGFERLASHAIDARILSDGPREGGYPAAMPVSFIAGTGHLGVYRRNGTRKLGRCFKSVRAITAGARRGETRGNGETRFNLMTRGEWMKTDRISAVPAEWAA